MLNVLTVTDEIPKRCIFPILRVNVLRSQASLLTLYFYYGIPPSLTLLEAYCLLNPFQMTPQNFDVTQHQDTRIQNMNMLESISIDILV